MIKLSKTVLASAPDYTEALLEACTKGGGVDPVLVLTETEAYPKVTREIDLAEFLVGWFHGVAESYDVTVEALWAQLAAGRVPETPVKRKAAAKVKATPPANPPNRAPRPVATPTPPRLAIVPPPAPAPTPVATGKTTIVDPADVPRVFVAPGTQSPPPTTPKGRRKKAAAAQPMLPMG